MTKPRLRVRMSAALAVTGALVVAPGAPLARAQQKPLTVAEESQYKATSRYADVMKFIAELQARTPFLRVETLCTSAEGRNVPLLVIGKPLPALPSELRQDNRGIIYLQANIHAGEVEGKEATLMLARDILLDEKTPYLDKLVLLIAPIFNADGNERISPENRRNQPGPEQGVGIRFNGQNLDLNRDSMKLESPELRGLVENVLNRWDPLLLVDCHTTDGAYHQEIVTYSWAMNPNGSPSLIAYQRDRMMPAIEDILEKKYNTPAVGYGGFKDFRAPEKGWQAMEHEPRYVTNYIGLRNRLSILDENYVHADFRTRVMGNYAFLRAILDYCSAHLDEMGRLVAEADRRTVLKGLHPTEKDLFYVDYELLPLKNPVTIHAYETEVIPQGQGRRPLVKPTDRVKVVTTTYYADWEGKNGVPFPFAYIMAVPDERVVANLLKHGIVVERLVEPAALDVTSFKPSEIKASGRLFQGHWMDQVKGDYVTEKREIPAGSYVVATGQPLGNLAAYLLEPQSDDGLLVWNFFDRYLVPEWSRELETYPVYKLLAPANLVTEVVTR
jgi:murein tripeptide amidase MpaA